METKITTAEKLGMELYGCMNSAVLDYSDYTVAVWEHCFKGSIAEVYELVETPEETGLGRCECRISESVIIQMPLQIRNINTIFLQITNRLFGRIDKPPIIAPSIPRYIRKK